MANVVSTAPVITRTSPATEPEWLDAGILIDELIDWDFERFRALGFERAEMVSAFYPDNLEDVRRHGSGADGRFLLARHFAAHTLSMQCDLRDADAHATDAG